MFNIFSMLLPLSLVYLISQQVYWRKQHQKENYMLQLAMKHTAIFLVKKLLN